jgi:hypothetical protein
MSERLVPLCVDLDGTLIDEDMLKASIRSLWSTRPSVLLSLPYWLAHGRPYFKKRIAAAATLDPARLSYHPVLVEELRAARALGRPVLLVTGSDILDATRVSNHLGLFDEVIATDGGANLVGYRKAQILVERFRSRGFDYVGNSWPDMFVWRHARRAWVVTSKAALHFAVRRVTTVEQILPWR